MLGLLALGPRTGYELVTEFDGDLGRWAWQAGYSSVYPELHRMSKAGLVSVVGEGARGSITYSISQAGREELNSWMLFPPRSSRVRNEHALRMFLVSTLDPADAQIVLNRIATEAETDAATLRQIRAEQTEAGDENAFGVLAAEYGLRLNRTIIEWARWASERVAASGEAGVNSHER